MTVAAEGPRRHVGGSRTRLGRLGREIELVPAPAAILPAAPAAIDRVPSAERREGSVSALLGTLADSLMGRLRRRVDPDFDRRYHAILKRLGPHGYDPFGFNLEYASYALVAAAWLYRRYFRCEVTGIERVPPGRAILAANHSGQIPIDGFMIGTAMLLDHEPPRLIRSMIEIWAATLPFAAKFFARCGQVIGLPENCRLLLDRDEVILVFPEGTRGITKTIDRAYRLEEFGQGFVRLALETGSPIVPVAVVGAEEQYPAVLNLASVARWIGAPAVPVTPLMALGPIGLLPLPTRYRITFGEPIRLSGDADEDDEAVAEGVRVVRSAVQDLLNRTLAARKHVFW